MFEKLQLSAEGCFQLVASHFTLKKTGEDDLLGVIMSLYSTNV